MRSICPKRVWGGATQTAPCPAITQQTGLQITRAIVAGERDPAQLARFRHGRCRATPAEITAALTGHYRPELLFALQQNLELYDACERQIAECDRVIEAHVRTLTANITPPGPLPAARAARQRIEPAFEIRAMLHHLTGGVDLTQIDGIGAYTALKLVAEIGTDMRRWPSAQHFTSWLTLAPKNKVSGGKLLSSQTQPSANRAAAIFRMAAMTLGRTQTALGAFYRRVAFRIGKPKAITATARKLAVLVYRMLKDHLVYIDPGAEAAMGRCEPGGKETPRKLKELLAGREPQRDGAAAAPGSSSRPSIPSWGGRSP